MITTNRGAGRGRASRCATRIAAAQRRNVLRDAIFLDSASERVYRLHRMPFSYIVHKELNLVVSTGRDRLSWNEISACQGQALTDPNFNPEFNQIADLRAVTSVNMAYDQIRVLAARTIFNFPSRRAFVAPNPVVFGVARMWEAITELSSNLSQIRVFYGLPPALKWLGLEELP